MNKIKDFFNNVGYSLINGGTGGAILIWLLVSGVYAAFFYTGGMLVVPITLIGCAVGFGAIILWLWKQRNK